MLLTKKLSVNDADALRVIGWVVLPVSVSSGDMESVSEVVGVSLKVMTSLFVGVGAVSVCDIDIVSTVDVFSSVRERDADSVSVLDDDTLRV